MIGIARIAALTTLTVVAGCGTVELFGTYDLPESESVASAPWPRLADVPEAPPPGQYSDAVPDPAKGFAVETDLTALAAEAEQRAAILAAPVLSEADRRRLLGPR